MSLIEENNNEKIKKSRIFLIEESLPNKLQITNIGLINKKQFKLLEPKKGHLIKKLIYSGYSKNNLSSIPRGTEIILMNKRKDSLKVKLNNKELSKILQNKNESNDKTNISLSTSNEIDNNSVNINKTFINKGNSIIKNIFKDYKRNKMLKSGSKTERFNLENYKEYISKFSPGPCDYISDINLNILSNKKNYRYKSLFNLPKIIEKKELKNNPGPGSYNTSGNILLNKSKLGITLNQREIRFKNLSAKNINPLGPGEYFKSIIFIDKNHKVKDNRLKSLPLKTKINPIIKKYIVTQDKKDFEVPGPGQYNLKSCFNKINLFKKSNNRIHNSKNKKFIPEEIMKEYLIKKRENNSENNYLMISNNNSIQDSSQFINNNYENLYKSQKIGITLPFVSKSKRIAFLDSSINKHIPGPCYYDLYSNFY